VLQKPFDTAFLLLNIEAQGTFAPLCISESYVYSPHRRWWGAGLWNDDFLTNFLLEWSS